MILKKMGISVINITFVSLGVFFSCEPDYSIDRSGLNYEDETDVQALVIDTLPSSQPMKHVGALHTPADFERIKSKLDADQSPWVEAYALLESNRHAQASYTPNPVEKLIRGGNSAEEPEPDNYGVAFNDAAAAYQLALRWKISGESQFADSAINILNSWASVNKEISGNSNVALAAGLYGYQFAIAGELLRDYEGWQAADFEKYTTWLETVYLDLNMQFLETHWGTCDTHYWANWDLANVLSVLAIGIVTDQRSVYNYGINYLQNGDGNGNWYKAIYHVFDDEGLAQIQESGRDQGHTLLCIGLMGHIAQLTWNQGDDFYGLDDNRLFKATEYVAKYNVASLPVPFKDYTRKWGTNCVSEEYTEISDYGRGTARPIWSAPYYHYKNEKNLSPQYIELGVQSTTPEGGGGNYGGNSGGFDQLGFGTLMYTR